MGLDAIFDRELVEETEGEIVVLQYKSDQNPTLAYQYHGNITLSPSKDGLKIIQTENYRKT